MTAESPLSPRKLRSKVADLFTTLEIDVSNPSLIKVVPVAYPVTSVVYATRERHVGQRGIIDRYVLDAVRRFGPMGAADVHAMLGVEEEIVRRILQNAADLGKGVECSRDVYTVESPAATERFSTEATHTRRFIVDGVDGKLLPMAYAEQLDTARLFPDEEKCAVRDMDGKQTLLRMIVRHGLFDEGERIREVIRKAGAGLKQELGMPGEIVELGKQDYSKRETAWIPAFLLVYADESMQLRGMLPGFKVFLDRRRCSRHWLKSASVRRVSLKLDVDDAYLRENLEGLFDGFDIKISKAGNRLELGGDDEAWDISRFIASNEAGHGVIYALADGIHWDPFQGHVFALVPDGFDATTSMCLFDAVRKLRSAQHYDKRLPEKAAWWAEHSTTYLERYSAEWAVTGILLAELDRCIDLCPDTALQEWYEEWE